MVRPWNHEHVIAIELQHLPTPEILQVSCDQDVGLSCNGCQQDMAVILDFVEHPSCSASACARPFAYGGNLRVLFRGKRNEAGANDEKRREWKRSFPGCVIKQPGNP